MKRRAKTYVERKLNAVLAEARHSHKMKEMSKVKPKYTIKGTSFIGTMEDAIREFGSEFLVLNKLTPVE
jgi:hypothetical protein